MCIVLSIMLSAGCLGTFAATLPAPTDTAHSPRIICLTSDAAELLIIIGAGDHVVGIPETLVQNKPNLVPLLQNARSIGNAKTPDNEKIIDLKPDVVIYASAIRPAATDKWASSGIRVIPLDCHKAADLPGIARTLGMLTGHTEKAEKYAEFSEQTFSMMTSRLAQKSGSRPRVYTESYTDYFAYGNATGANAVIDSLGGDNIAGLIFIQSSRVSTEWIVKQDPEVMFKSVIPSENKTLEHEHARILERQGFNEIKAVKNGHVYVVSGDLLFSPHAPIGMLYLAKALYPEKFADVQPEDMLKEYANTFLPGTDQQPTMYPVPWN